MSFAILTVVSMYFCFLFYNVCVEFIKNARENKPENYDFPKAADFKISAYSTVAFYFIEIAIRKLAYIAFVPFCKE